MSLDTNNNSKIFDSPMTGTEKSTQLIQNFTNGHSGHLSNCMSIIMIQQQKKQSQSVSFQYQNDCQMKRNKNILMTIDSHTLTTSQYSDRSTSKQPSHKKISMKTGTAKEQVDQ